MNDATIMGHETFEASTQTPRLAKIKTIPPRSEAPVIVGITEGGRFMVEILRYKTDEMRLQIAKIVVET